MIEPIPYSKLSVTCKIHAYRMARKDDLFMSKQIIAGEAKFTMDTDGDLVTLRIPGTDRFVTFNKKDKPAPKQKTVLTEPGGINPTGTPEEKMWTIFWYYVKRYNIRIEKWSRTSCGYALTKTNQIKTPKPSNIENLMVGLHEVCHIADKTKQNSMRRWEQEYRAEMFAIREMQRYTIFDSETDRKAIEDYTTRAKGYVAMTMCKGFRRGLDLATVDKEALAFAEIDVDKWNDARDNGRMPLISTWGSKAVTGGKSYQVTYPIKTKIEFVIRKKIKIEFR